MSEVNQEQLKVEIFIFHILQGQWYNLERDFPQRGEHWQTISYKRPDLQLLTLYPPPLLSNHFAS